MYDRRDLDAIPRRYTIIGHGEFADSWAISGAGYDLQIIGPEGFHRRVAGAALDQEEISFERDGGLLRLRALTRGLLLQMAQADAADPLELGDALTLPVGDDGRYDVTVVSAPRRTFLRQFAGRLPGL